MLRKIKSKSGEVVAICLIQMMLCTIVVTAIMEQVAKRHHQQRIEKQATAEGRAEYPMKEKVPLTPRELMRKSLSMGK